jgi:hypothetical protein
MKKKDNATSEVIDNKERARQFLDMIRAGHDLPSEERLYFVLSAIKENLRYHHWPSREVFKTVLDDPKGSEYWRGWFDMPGLTVEKFADLLAIHAAAEFADDAQLNKDDQTPLEIYQARKETVIMALQEAAEMNALEFEGDIDALLSMKRSYAFQGWVLKDKAIKSLTKVKIYPRDTLGWFAACPERKDLVPGSLKAWWSTQPQSLNIEHSPCFHSINKDGVLYTLTTKQAQVYEILWDANEKGASEVGQDYILEMVSPTTTRLRDIFKKNLSAWKELIASGKRKGTFHLKT